MGCSSFLEKNKNLERFLKSDNNLTHSKNSKRLYYQGIVLKRIKELFLELDFKDKSVDSQRTPVSTGVMMYEGDLCKLKERINLLLSNLISEFFDISNYYRTPSLLERKTAQKCGYFNVGSQHMFFVNQLKKNTDIFDKYDKFLQESKSIEKLSEFLEESELVLTPAVCLHLYPHLNNQNLNLNSDGYIGFDVLGNAYRDEGGNINNTNRFREFNVHEFVFFGSQEKLQDLFLDILDFMMIFLDSLLILKNVEYSNDMFFGSQEQDLLFSQIITKDKIEAIGIKTSGSIASINFHKDKFTREFDISADTKINSMCLAFGIDRIINEIIQNESYKYYKNNI